jgi:hypothetical protein
MNEQPQNTNVQEESKVLPRMFILVDREQKRTPLQYFYLRTYAKVVEWLDINSFPFLILGLFLNSYFLVNEISTLNVAFECLYAVVFIYKIFQTASRKKQTGTVTDAVTKAPVDLATVRVAAGERFIQVRVTDKTGLFFIILQPGNYTIYCSKTGYETTSKKVFVPKGKKLKVAKIDFALRKTAS